MGSCCGGSSDGRVPVVPSKQVLRVRIPSPAPVETASQREGGCMERGATMTTQNELLAREITGEVRPVTKRRKRNGLSASLWWCPFCDRSHQEQMRRCMGCGAHLVTSMETADRIPGTASPTGKGEASRYEVLWGDSDPQLRGRKRGAWPCRDCTRAFASRVALMTHAVLLEHGKPPSSRNG